MKTSEELQGMKVVDLRSYAKELGIKNVKTYVKENLIKEILIKESASAKDIQGILNELKSSNFIGLEHWLYDPTIFTDRETGEESIRLSKQYWAKDGDDLRKVEEEEMESNLRELKERYGDCFRIENKNSHVLWIKSKKGKTQPKAEEPVVEVEESAKSIEINPMITEEPSFYEFVKKYNGSIEIQKDSAKIEIIFSNKENYKAAVQEYKNNKKFKTNFYCFDNFLHSIILYSKKSVERKKRTESDIPNGPQSLAIYNMMIEHPTWTHYKIKSLLNCTYTNVRRVYLKYIKGTEYDKR